MRSVYCIGAVEGLLQRDALGSASYICSTSAGCVAATAFASSRGDLSRYRALVDLLLDRVAGERFINTRRLKRVVDVDFLVDSMIEVLSLSPSTFDHLDGYEVSLTRADGRPEYVDCRGMSVSDLRAVLIASMAIPVLYPVAAYWRGERMFDGGVSDPLPILRAVEASSCDTIIGISNVARGRIGRPASLSERVMLGLTAAMIPEGIRYQTYAVNSLGVTVDRLLDRGEFAGYALVRISPSDPSVLGERTDTDRGHLNRLRTMGSADARSVSFPRLDD